MSGRLPPAARSSFAFPRLYASSFSGFYLPLMIVLWLLMLRGMGIELRSHVGDPLWRSFFDFLLALAGPLLAVFFGAAVGYFAFLYRSFRGKVTPAEGGEH